MANYMDKNLQVPNYSGVNIQIFNPAVNMPSQGNVPQIITGQQPVQPRTVQALPQPVQQIAETTPPAMTGQAEVVAPNPWATIPQGSVFTNNNQVNNNIQYHVSDLVVTAIDEFIKYTKKLNDIESVMYLLFIASDIIENEEYTLISKQMEKILEERMNKNG